MALPTGSGSEILKRTTINGQSDSETAFRWDGTMATTGTNSYTVPALHIITVLNVIAAENGSNAVPAFKMIGYDGANNIYIVAEQSIPADGTFVWDNKIVLYPGDKLIMQCGASANIDLWCSYIDQNWED